MKSPLRPEKEFKDIDSLLQAQLPERLVYSLLGAAVRVAAHTGVPMGRFIDIAKIAYFSEVRARHPKSLDEVAEKLDLSTRHIGNIVKLLKSDLFQPENVVQPLRRITSLLLVKKRTRKEIGNALEDLSDRQIDKSLKELESLGWIKKEGTRFILSETTRNYVQKGLLRRVDGLNHQVEIFARGVIARFLESSDAPGVVRTWTFPAIPSKIPEFVDKALKAIRYETIGLEEEALEEGGGHPRFGLNLIVTELDEA